jgi:uncharacterized protein (DUF697 family)/uncharacterized tellurite resistance protein B-like protein
MAIAENEALASLRILVAVARADGTIHNDERRSLAAALESLELPGGMTVERLLQEDTDVDAQLRELTTPDAREQIYRSAYFMAYADGTCTSEEQALLDRIAQATDVSDETRASLDRIFVGRASSVGVAPKRRVSKIDDEFRRTTEIESRITRYAVLSGVLGAFPIPGIAIATDLAVIGLQISMISDIGAMFGHTVDRKAAKSLLYGVGLGTGARLAVNNLAKLLPGWGSVVGATTSFVSTFALGKVIEQVYASGGVATKESLRTQFKEAEQSARDVYANQKDVIIQSQRTHQLALDGLTADLKAGKISQAEFDERVTELA